MQTFKRVTALCMVLIMMLSAMSLSLIASAAEINTTVVFSNQVNSITQGTVTNTGNANKRNAKALLDYLDAILAEQGIKEEIVLIEPGLFTKGLVITIDATSVDGILGTIDLVKSVSGLMGTLGSLKQLNCKNWTTKQTRAKTGDDAVLKNLIQFLYDNRELISDVADGSFSAGMADSLLGLDPDKGETLLKLLLKDFSFLSEFLKAKLAEVAGTPELSKSTLDTIIFDGLIDKKLAPEYLPGFDMSASTTTAELIISLVNSVWAKYVTPNVTKITEIQGSVSSNEYTAPLAGLVNFGVTGDDVAITFNKIEDANDAIGKVVAAATTYTGWTAGADLSLISTNVVNAIKWVFDNADTSASSDEVKAKYAAWAAEETEAGALLAVVKLVVNAAWPEYAATVDAQTTVEGALIAVLTKLIEENKVGENGEPGSLAFAVIGKNSNTAEKFLGDFAGSFLAQYIPLKDANGKAYVAGSGTDIYTVANYALNYFLVDLNLDALLGLNMTKADSLYTKLEALQNALLGTIPYVKASTYIPDLVENVLNLNVGGLFTENVQPLINDYKDLSVAELLYTVVNNLLKAVLGRQVLADSTFKSFESILRSSGAKTDDNLGKVVVNLLAGLEARKADLLPIVYYAYNALFTDKTYTVLSTWDLAKSTKANTAFVKYGDEALTQGTDYTVSIANGGKVGTTKLTVKGVGNYAGTVTKNITITCSHKKVTQKAVAATYTKAGKTAGSYCSVCGQVLAAQKTTAKLTLGKVTGLKAKKIDVDKSSSITLSWNKVTGAQKYEVYVKSGSSWKKLTTTDKTSYTVKKDGKKKSLKAGSSYEFKVRAVRTGDKVNGAYSSVLKVKIAPSAPTLSKLSAGKKQLTASWKSVSGASGYEVQYSTSSKMKKAKTVKVKKSAKKTTIKKLSKGKKYYVRVRTYKTVNGKKIYSAWSAVKNVKVK